MLYRILGVTILCWLFAEVGSADDTSSNAITVIMNIRYREGPSKHWQLDLAMKKGLRGKPRPGIVIIHGGGWLEGDKSSFTLRKYGSPANIEDFAALGFVAVTINYRLSREAPFPAALEDCQCAIRWLRAHARDYNLDTKHIGAYGNSAGGHLALLLAMAKEPELGTNAPYREQSSLVQAAVSDSGPVDLLYQLHQGTLKSVVTQFLGGPAEGERAALYKRASPIHQINRATSPLLLIYGGADDQVPVESTDQFVAALDRAGVKDVTYHRLAYVYHCPHSLVRVPWLRPVVNEFLLRTLMHPETAQQIKRRVGSR
jgi:acetyl esterase/lipase